MYKLRWANFEYVWTQHDYDIHNSYGIQYWDNMYYIVLYSAFIAWFIEFVRILVMGTEISVGDCMHLSA